MTNKKSSGPSTSNPYRSEKKAPVHSDTRRNRSKLHEGLNKATSALITQIRTEKIGLNAFLTDRKVPGYTAKCPYGAAR